MAFTTQTTPVLTTPPMMGPGYANTYTFKTGNPPSTGPAFNYTYNSKQTAGNLPNTEPA